MVPIFTWCVCVGAADRPPLHRAAPFHAPWQSDRPPPYEYRGVPFHRRGGMGYPPSRGARFPRRGPRITIARGSRHQIPVGSRSRSRSRSRSSRSRSKSGTRTTSRSHSAEAGRTRKRDVSIPLVNHSFNCASQTDALCRRSSAVHPACPYRVMSVLGRWTNSLQLVTS